MQTQYGGEDTSILTKLKCRFILIFLWLKLRGRFKGNSLFYFGFLGGVVNYSKRDILKSKLEMICSVFFFFRERNWGKSLLVWFVAKHKDEGENITNGKITCRAWLLVLVEIEIDRLKVSE